ncbi:MAG: proline--tRNA ligase [bacterium]|nr:proline--tRNA ligase [bacterium]
MNKLTSQEKDFSTWYNNIVLRAELADYAPVKGCMVIRPYGYGIWENIQSILDKMIKSVGAQNAYFPLLIPESFIHKEKKHLAGFSPELAVVTYGGGKELEEKLIVRPTSETIINAMFSKWIQSFRDLPLLINQWANIVRWEMRTRLFLRTTEFLWQEGHTAHSTHDEASEMALTILTIYRDFMQNTLAIPVIYGTKTLSQRFAGALETYTIEAMMGDRKALQAGTSHDLGQNFSKAFDITYQTKENKLDYVWQTSWGVSTRLIGAVVMVHGDDKGLVLPPNIAPIQVIIVPIWKGDEKGKTVKAVLSLEKRCKNNNKDSGSSLRVRVDTREEFTPGFKFNEWEMKGVPLRVEIGPRDIENSTVTIARRDEGTRMVVKSSEAVEVIIRTLNEIQKNLFLKARRFIDNNTYLVDDWNEFKHKTGFILSHWCGSAECETNIQNETNMTIRCISMDTEEEEGKCIFCGKQSKRRVVFAKAY